MPDEKEDTSFKVVDRRPFAPDGSVRPESETAAEMPDRAPAAGPSAASGRGDERAETARPESAGDKFSESASLEPREDFGLEGGDAGEYSGFETLISYLGTTAMFQMGLVAGPGGQRIPADLVNARNTIDMIEVLERKTRGNLTPEEARLLEDVLYELRLAYVEVERGASRPK
jgi:Domain of unknown function (DUF1844)